MQAHLCSELLHLSNTAHLGLSAEEALYEAKDLPVPRGLSFARKGARYEVCCKGHVRYCLAVFFLFAVSSSTQNQNHPGCCCCAGYSWLWRGKRGFSVAVADSYTQQRAVANADAGS